MKSSRKMRAAGAASAVAALLLLTACSAASGDSVSAGVTDKKIVIGVSSDVTGPAAANIMPYLNGIKAYVGDLNEKGGIHGRTINLVVEDDKTETPKGVSIYRKFLTQEPALAQLGPSSATIQNAIASQVAEQDMPVVGPLITSADIVNPFNPHFFSLACTYADQADVAVAYMIRKTGVEKPRVVTALTETASGKEWASLIKERVESVGGTVVAEHTLQYGALDEDVFAQAVAKDKPDMLFLHGATNTAQVMMKSFAKFGVTNLPIGASAVMQDALIPAAGPNVSNNYYAFDCYRNPADAGIPGDAAIAAGKKIGLNETDYLRPQFTQGYVAASVLAKAIEDSGSSPTRESVNEKLAAIKDLDTGGLSPTITFGSDNRLGVNGMLAYRFDPASKKFTPEGEFEDYAGCITKYYVTKSIAEWSPDCIR
ncbi:ABC transporter substrate-binding protein [Rhodococcus sp. WS4]|nr:ABC transporter substrate-binding protein [Rhodococcus sp. WS4]